MPRREGDRLGVRGGRDESRPYMTCLVAVVMAVGCGSASPVPAASTRSERGAACDYYDYRFELDADLRHMTALVCFDGPPPPALVCGPEGDPEHAPNAERVSGQSATPLSTRGCRIDLAGLGAGDCVRYTIDLRAGERPLPMSLASHGANVVTTQVGAFLFRPEVRAAAMHGHATLTMPEGVQASLPWPRDADGYLLDGTAFEQVGYAAFGALDREPLVLAGATLEVALVDTLAPETRAAIVPWMHSVVGAASQIGGAFPTERAQIILVPQAGSGGVRFGMVGRGGGPSVVLVLGRDSSHAQLIESWEPAHELTHLRTPFVVRADRWLTEGIATYYQEVLRARAGITTAAHAWTRLHSGLSRAAALGTGRTLRNESADMYTTGAFQRVYWAGVAFAWMADVELRRGSDNAISLDTVVLGLQARCAHQDRTWTAAEMLSQMDVLAGRPAFTELAQRQLDQAAFPDVTTTFAALGITLGDGDAVLDPVCPLAAVRDAIMAPVITNDCGAPQASDALPLAPARDCGAEDRPPRVDRNARSWEKPRACH